MHALQLLRHHLRRFCVQFSRSAHVHIVLRRCVKHCAITRTHTAKQGSALVGTHCAPEAALPLPPAMTPLKQAVGPTGLSRHVGASGWRPSATSTAALSCCGVSFRSTIWWNKRPMSSAHNHARETWQGRAAVQSRGLWYVVTTWDSVLLQCYCALSESRRHGCAAAHLCLLTRWSPGHAHSRAPSTVRLPP